MNSRLHLQGLLAVLLLSQASLRAEETAPVNQSELVSRMVSGPKPAMLAFGEIKDGHYIVQEADQPLRANFNSEVFFVVSNLDGWLAGILDASDPYSKAWKLNLDSQVDTTNPLKTAQLALDLAKNEQKKAVEMRLSKTGDSAVVSAMDLEIKRQDAAVKAADKAVEDMKRAQEDAKKLVSRGFQELGVHFRLRLGEETFKMLHPSDLVRMIDSKKSLFLLRFRLSETNRDKEAWLRLLKNSPVDSVRTNIMLAYLNPDGRESILTSTPPYQLQISLFRWPFWTSFAVIAVCLFIFVRHLRDTGMLRDQSISIINREADNSDYWHIHDHPLSMGRLQMSIWFFIIIGAFVFLWSTTGSLAGVNSTAFALMGISGGTTMVSAFVSNNQTWDAKKRAPAAKSNNHTSNILLDLLSDESGPTIHRFQMLAWTLVLGVVFIHGVISEYAMPVFSTELLGLMGISSGVYVGFKMKEGGPSSDSK